MSPRQQYPGPYDPAYKKAAPEPSWHWAYTFMLVGIFFGLASLAWAGHLTFITKVRLSQVLAFFCCIGLVIPWKYYRKWIGLHGPAVFAFNILGVGPVLLSSLLWVNYLIRTDHHTEVHTIVGRDIDKQMLINNSAVFYTLENDALHDHPEFRKFMLYEETLSVLEARKIEYEIARGLLGYDVLVRKTALGAKGAVLVRERW